MSATDFDILNLGSGNKRRAGALNIDVARQTEPDLVHDLNCTPWPLPGNQFAEVHAYDVLEHLRDVVQSLEEIHRVCKPGAKVFITVPHFSSANAFTDPTHLHYFGARSMTYVTGADEFGFYSPVRFASRNTMIVFYPTLLNRLVRRVANRYPDAYERRWAWMFPAWFLYFELEATKTLPSKDQP